MTRSQEEQEKSLDNLYENAYDMCRLQLAALQDTFMLSDWFMEQMAEQFAYEAVEARKAAFAEGSEE